jgi:hypothetical protein
MRLKSKLTMLAGGIALALAGPTHAAFSFPNTGNSSLVLNVWDIVTNESYNRQLGVRLNDFLPNSVPITDDNPAAGNKTPNSPYLLVDKTTFSLFGGDTLFNTLFGNNTASNIRWSITATDQNTFDGPGGTGVSRVMTTTQVGSTPNASNGQTRVGSQQMELHLQAAVGLSSADSVQGPTSGNGFNGDTSWGPDFGGAFVGLNNAAIGFGSLLNAVLFRETEPDGTVGTAAVRNIYVAADGTRYTFTLESDGDVVYCGGTACPTGVIPIPAAAWLFGSGLLGLAGVARRRTAAAAA